MIEHAQGIALRGTGRTEDALHQFERILASSPGHAGALQQAALCCYDLNRKVEGNRYAKAAARLGLPVPRSPRSHRGA